MISIQISPRRRSHPLPIRSGEIEIIPQTRHERRGGKIRSITKNHRSQKTVWLYPGQKVGPVPDSWADLPDVKAYRKRGWVVIRKVETESVSNRLENQPSTKSSKPSKKRSR